MAAGANLILKEQARGGGQVIRSGAASWRLEIPTGSARNYRLAQLDDYAGLSRKNFLRHPSLEIRLRTRASARAIPGTWGLGLWNDPFGMSMVQGSEVRLPTLPNCAWFFFASQPNHLSFRDDLPGWGQLAAVFRSPANLPPGLIACLPLMPLIFLRPVARWLRRIVARHVHQDTQVLDLDPTEWHEYMVAWRPGGMIFYLDGQVLKEMSIQPRGPLGLVIWIDNQYAKWTPDGRLGFGTLHNDRASWIEIEGLELSVA